MFLVKWPENNSTKNSRRVWKIHWKEKQCKKFQSINLPAPALMALYMYIFIPSVLWRCWLGGRKGVRPVKIWVVGCWHGYFLERGADLHMAQLMPLPLTISCFIKIQIGFTFLVPADPGSPGQRAVERVCVWVICLCESGLANSSWFSSCVWKKNFHMSVIMSFTSQLSFLSPNQQCQLSKHWRKQLHQSSMKYYMLWLWLCILSQCVSLICLVIFLLSTF